MRLCENDQQRNGRERARATLHRSARWPTACLGGPSPMRRLLLTSLFLASVVLLFAASSARADDGGADALADDAGDASGDDAGDPDEGDAESSGPTTVAACDGALCSTIGNGPTCAVQSNAVGRSGAADSVTVGTFLLLAVITVAARAKRRQRSRASLGLLAFALALAAGARTAAADVVPPPAELPTVLTLDEALSILRTRGLDLLIAEAAVHNAEGAIHIAGAVPNPVVSGSLGYAYTYQPNDPSCQAGGTGCSNQVWSVGVSDSAALEDTISGKRDLRLKVARNALAAAKLSRNDALRTLTFQVKSAYANVAQAVLGYKFAKKTADSNVVTLEKFKRRFALGANTDADVARIITQKLESDQSLAQAVQALRTARISLAFLLGVRGMIPDFEVDTKVLDYRPLATVTAATEGAFLKLAYTHRPDLLAAAYQKESARWQVSLVKRQRFPDITLSLNYTAGGYGGAGTNTALASPMFTFGLSAPIPLFYQLQGELQQAEAALDTNALQHAKAAAQVANDVATAVATERSTREQAERMEATDGLLWAAKRAFEILAIQYDKGAPGVSLTDYLDAYRTYIATQVEEYGDLTNYWTAVFQLEEATGMELR